MWTPRSPKGCAGEGSTSSRVETMEQTPGTISEFWSGPPNLAALFSQDDDLLAIAHRLQLAGSSFAGLIYGHQLDLSIGQAVRDLELIAQVYDPDDLRDRVEYLPL